MTDVIKEAIEQKKPLSFIYKNLERVVEPHAYGRSKPGNDIMRAYQTRGDSESGGIPEWRLFRKDGMRDVRLLDEVTQMPRQGYRRGDKAMHVIYCQV